MEAIKTFPVRLTESTHKRLKDVAHDQRISMHEFVLLAVEEKMREVEKEEKK